MDQPLQRPDSPARIHIPAQDRRSFDAYDDQSRDNRKDSISSQTSRHYHPHHYRLSSDALEAKSSYYPTVRRADSIMSTTSAPSSCSSSLSSPDLTSPSPRSTPSSFFALPVRSARSSVTRDTPSPYPGETRPRRQGSDASERASSSRKAFDLPRPLSNATVPAATERAPRTYSAMTESFASLSPRHSSISGPRPHETELSAEVRRMFGD